MFSPRLQHVVATCIYIVFGLLSAFAERELHVIGIYEGIGGGAAAPVYVDRPGQSVTLFLSSYDPVTWTVAVSTGTSLERVFISGYHHQSIQGVPASVPVYSTSYDDGTGYLWIGYSVESSRFLRSVPEIAALTNQEIASFQGAYQPPSTGFTINVIQNDPRLSSKYPEPVPISELPLVTFDLATYSERLSIRHYRLDGPMDGGALIDAGFVMDADAAGRYYYGGTDGLVEFDTQTDLARTIPPSPETAQEGWQMGTAFDRKRGRALLVTLAGEGFLYGYSPAIAQWNLRISMQNRDFDCITYHDADDSLYAVTTSHEDSHYANIVKLTADGAFVKEIKLPILPFDIGPGSYHRSELVSAGEYLVLLLGPQSFWHPTTLPESRMYLIDPRTSEVWLTYRYKGPPNQPPTATIQIPKDGTLVTPGSTVQLTAMARDGDGLVSSVEFFVNDQSVGLGAPAAVPGFFVRNWTVPESGTHEIIAKATDNKGATGVSAAVSVIVNRVPTVTITAPANGGNFETGSAVTLTANAADPDGTIASVVFLLNGQVFGTASLIPGTDNYSVTWTAATAGTYTVGARAMDNAGSVVNAATIQVTVIGDPTTAVTAKRILPRFYQPGKKLTVVITTKPTRISSSYSVVDRPPIGWTVSAISPGGRLDPVTGSVVFGPYTDRRPRSFVYRVTTPAHATGPAQFVGTVVVNGSETPIAGDGTVETSPRKARPSIRSEIKQSYE